MLFAWDEPALREKRLVVHVKGFEREINILEIGPLVPMSYQVFYIPISKVTYLMSLSCYHEL